MKDGTSITKYFEELKSKWDYGEMHIEKLKKIRRCYVVAPAELLGDESRLEYQLRALISNKSGKARSKL